MRNQSASSVVALFLLSNTCIFTYTTAFAPAPQHAKTDSHVLLTSTIGTVGRRKHSFITAIHMSNNPGAEPYYDDGDEEDDDDEEESLYQQFAASEFLDDENTAGAITQSSLNKPVDWGGEYDTLRSRVNDSKEAGGKISPSRALFRVMTSESPNEAIMNFVSGASPQVVTAMSSAVTSLLGGLANPGAGVETIVKANGEKLGSLCFQLQMTGYMFRNAEYVLAIRDLMNIQGSATLDDYKRAFDKLDSDGSGYIESSEVEDLLSDVYGEDTPAFEVDTFLQFFDSNNDGRISWEEFERGLGVVADKAAKSQRSSYNKNGALGALPGSADDDDDDDDDYIDDDDILGEPSLSGKIQIEMKNGKVIEVEAKEYIDELKKEAEALKAALSRETGVSQKEQQSLPGSVPGQPPSPDGISTYIASLQGDIQSLTKGISPEVVEAMKMLVDFVLDGGPGGSKSGMDKKAANEIEMEIPGSALQQLALWQLVLGYKLRESEATGEYRKMLE